jgi:hypothetical protein
VQSRDTSSRHEPPAQHDETSDTSEHIEGHRKYWQDGCAETAVPTAAPEEKPGHQKGNAMKSNCDNQSAKHRAVHAPGAVGLTMAG